MNQSKTWFEARSGFRIEPVEIVRETDKSVWLKRAPGVRVPKDGGYMAYFPTVEQAKQFIVGRAERRLAECEHRLEDAKTSLERAQLALEKAKLIEVSEPINLSNPILI